MKEYTLIYLPFGTETKKWVHIRATSQTKAIEKAEQYGIIIKLTENK
jgi:hypothetical protein